MVSPISAYEIPYDCYYFEFRDNNLGDVTIYLPVTNFTFSHMDFNPINVGSSNITGYMNYNGNEISITFQPYQFGRYRLNNTQNNVYLDGVVLTQNFDFIEIDTKRLDFNYQIYMLVLLGIGVLGLWIPSYKH